MAKYLDEQGLGVLVTNIKAGDKKNADAIAALEALHAKVGGTGANKDNFKTVAQEAAAAVATVVANAPAAYDTLKEIADWIGTGDVTSTTAAAMLSDISALKTKVGSSSVASQISAVTGTPDTNKTLQAEIDDVEAAVSALQNAGGEPNVITSVKKNGTALTITNKAVDVTFNGSEIKLTGYSKASSAAAVAATDSVNAAIGKVEKALDGKQATISDLATIRSNAATGAGLADKVGGIAEGAQVNVIESVKLKTGSAAASALTVTNKSVTIDVSGKADVGHTHTAANITNFANAVAAVKVAAATAADSATNDGSGNDIASTYATKTELTTAMGGIEAIDDATINALFA